METVARDIILPGTPDEVWESVADLEEWFGGPITGDLAPGEVLRVGGRRAVVDRVDEPLRISLRWLDDEPSRVDITLEPLDDSTVVHVTETRIEPAVDPKLRIGFLSTAGSAVGGP
jgi:hypothetical protein